jgi:hypothetical protein
MDPIDRQSRRKRYVQRRALFYKREFLFAHCYRADVQITTIQSYRGNITLLQRKVHLQVADDGLACELRLKLE